MRIMQGLYLHIPFCEHKCIYCDFYSIEQTHGLKKFVDSLITEITLTAGSVDITNKFTTIFFGGGTPSLLTPVQLQKIIDTLHRHFQIAPDAEVTIEMNPGTVDLEKLRAYKDAGINRLSIGVQSFSSADLEFLTRIHTVQQAEICYEDARNSGFDNINLDIIFSLPIHSKTGWLNNIEKVINLAPDHVSAYSLTYEKGTPLYTMLKNKQVVPLQGELDAELFGLTMDMLEEAGFEQYEISNYAQPGKKCLHNRIYWEYHEYFGFGPSAHSFYKGKRYWNVNDLVKYYKQIRTGLLPKAGEELLTNQQKAEEEIFLGLRTSGIDLKKMKNMYNLDILKDKNGEISSFTARGFIIVENGCLRLTKQGKAFADMIATELI